MEILKALLWKHWKERYRSYWHRLWEVISSLIIFCILIAAKLIHSSGITFNMEDDTDELRHFDILYSPSNKLTWMLMYPICGPHHDNNTDLNADIKCYAMDNEEEINNYFRTRDPNSTSPVTVLQFENLNTTMYPRSLKYSMKHVGVQQEVETSFLRDFYRPYKEDTQYPPTRHSKFFANLQWTIDKTFLSRITNRHIEHTITLHDVNDYMPMEMRVAHNFLMLCTILAPLPYFLLTCAKFVDEKQTGCNEMLKLYGVQIKHVRYSQFLDFFVIGAFEAILITLVLKFFHTSTTHPILKGSNFIIIWVELVMHILIVTFLAFIVSTVAQSHQNSASLAILMYMFVILINSLLYGQKVKSVSLKLLVFTIAPQAPVLLFWDEVFFLEEKFDGIGFDSMFNNYDDRSDNVLIIWVMLFLQLLCLLLLAYYLDEITAGRYGQSIGWNFCFKKNFWKSKHLKVHFHVTAEQEVPKDARFFETVIPIPKIAIKLVNVTKVFKSSRERVTALDNLCLDVYKDQITVILGTNGAGKSTLMATITGLYPATSGKVYVKGYDNSVRIEDCRKFLAYCPQQDFVFDYLTVKESILFFELVRGESEENREVNAMSLIHHFKLTDVADQYSSKLSTGKRRCLQIACALMGDSQILILDEPTTGMDYDMQHALWNILLKVRRQKTILLSTTDMDEADALGDRIAVINKGRLKCNGSPMFLKNAMGTDFKVILKVRNQECSDKVEVALHNAFLGKSHKITIKSLSPNKTSISMPASERDAFPEIFDVLEAGQEQLGIEKMSIGISMEHVFLRFIEEDDEIASYFDDDGGEEYKRLKGCALRLSQLCRLIERVWKFIILHKVDFIVLQFLVPLLALITVTLSCNMRKRHGESNIDHSSSINSLEDKYVFTRTGKQLPLIQMSSYVNLVHSDDVRSDIVLNKFEVGFRMNEDNTDIYYRSYLSPESLNIFTNLFILTHALTNSSVDLKYTPLETKIKVKLTLPKNLYLCCMWSMWVGFFAILPIAPLILLCVDEYYRGVRFNHQMAGCPAYILWLSKLLTHMAVYTAIVPTTILFCTGLLDLDETFTTSTFLLALLLLLMMFGPAFLTFWYVLSFLMGKDKIVAKIYAISICFGLITPFFFYFIKQIDLPPSYKVVLWIALAIGHTFPTFTFSMAMVTMTARAHHNALCRLNKDLCPNKMINSLFMSRKMCCESDGEPFPYIDIEIYILLGQTVCFWVILILLQKRQITVISEYINNLGYRAPVREDRKELALVKKQENYVKQHIDALRKLTVEERQQSKDTILVDNLHKRFGCCSKPVIKNVTLSCQRGQCLVLLGKGSAGKSVLLQLISGYSCVTRGDCCVNGYFLKKNRDQYIAELAYVRREGLDDFLTGFSNVEMIASLQGYRKQDAKRLAIRYLRYIGLTAYTNALYESYSPGCGSRLALCLSLIGSSKAVLLDEPFSKVDPHKRPLVSRAINCLCKKNTACIVAETSMEWSLIGEFSNRLALLDSGEVVAVGSAKEIKNTLASGYTVQIKLNVDRAYHLNGLCVRYYNKIPDEVVNLPEKRFKNIVKSTLIIKGYYKLKQYIMDKDIQWNVAIPAQLSDMAVTKSESLRKYSVVAVQDQTLNQLKETFVERFATAELTEEYMTILKYRIRDPFREIKYSELFSNLEQIKAEFHVIEDYSLSEVSVLEVLTQIQLRGLRRASMMTEDSLQNTT